MVASAVQTDNTLTSEEAELLAAFRAKQFDKVGEVVGKRINVEEQRQEKAKSEHALELVAVKLVRAIDSVIDDLAYDLTKRRGESGRFAEEAAANDLLHQLAEFMIQADIGHGYERESMVKRHHLSDEQFSFDWFGVTRFANGELTPAATKQ